MFGVPLLVIRWQMRRPGRAMPESIPGLSWLARDYRENSTLIRTGWIVLGLGGGLVLGYVSARLPNASDYARELSPSIEPAPAALLGLGLVITALAGLLLGVGAIRSPRVDPPARLREGGGWLVFAFGDVAFLSGPLVAVVMSADSARRAEPLAFWLILHFGLLIVRPWRI